MDKEKLSSLVIRVQDGENEAMGDIYNATSGIVSYYCAKLLGFSDPGSAVSAVADIYGLIEKNIGSLADPGSFMQWLKITTVQYCVKKLGSSLGEEAWKAADDDALPDVHEVNPDDIIGQIAYAPQIKTAVPMMIADLTVTERLCAYSYYFFGMSPSQISQLAGVSESMVASKLKAVRFGVKMNMKFYSGLAEEDADDLVFSRQMIRDYLYADAEKITAEKKAEKPVPVSVQYRPESMKHPQQTVIAAPQSAPRKRPVKAVKSDEEEVLKRSADPLGESAHKSEKKQTITMIIIVIVAALVLIGGCIYAILTVRKIGKDKETTGSEVSLKSLALDKTQVTLEIGDNLVLTPSFTPSDTSNRSLVWQSQDESIVTIDESGKLKAVAVGKTYVRAISGAYLDYTENPDGEPIVAYCEVNVVCTPELLEITEKSLTLEPGETATLETRIYPSTAASLLSWNSSDSTVVSVDKTGKVTALKEGIAVISLVYDDSHFAICTIAVTAKKIPATKVTLDKTELVLAPGVTSRLTATVTPSDTTDKPIWISTDESIVKVDENGIVTAVAEGTAGVGVRYGTFVASCQITVSTPVTGIEIPKEEITVNVGEMVNLGDYAKIAPSNATNKAINFQITQGGSLILSVGDTSILAMSAGTVIVTAVSAENPNIKNFFIIAIKAAETT